VRSAESSTHRLGHRKTRSRSVALLLTGLALLLPPIAGVALNEMTIFGVPFALIYIFAVWALLIAGAALLARPLWAGQDAELSSAPTDPPPD
jgi:hypothetical protein